MRPIRAYIRGLVTAAAVALLVGAVSFASTETAPTKPPVKTSAHQTGKSTPASRTHKKSRRTTASRKRGQQKIDSDRARQIQEALIREHYLTGKPTGNWDASTQQALQKYQADNGWQSKTTPDSRALIKLGLGPDQQHLLNPESAMTSAPASGHAAPPQAKPPVPGDPPQPQNQ